MKSLSKKQRELMIASLQAARLKIMEGREPNICAALADLPYQRYLISWVNKMLGITQSHETTYTLERWLVHHGYLLNEMEASRQIVAFKIRNLRLEWLDWMILELIKEVKPKKYLVGVEYSAQINLEVEASTMEEAKSLARSRACQSVPYNHLAVKITEISEI